VQGSSATCRPLRYAAPGTFEATGGRLCCKMALKKWFIRFYKPPRNSWKYVDMVYTHTVINNGIRYYITVYIYISCNIHRHIHIYIHVHEIIYIHTINHSYCCYIVAIKQHSNLQYRPFWLLGHLVLHGPRWDQPRHSLEFVIYPTGMDAHVFRESIYIYVYIYTYMYVCIIDSIDMIEHICTSSII
jgi:hypothetical protein